MSEHRPEREVVCVDRIAPGGDGLGRLSSGELVFIKGAAPGDQIEVASIVRRKGVAHGEIGQIRQAGPHRIVPSCPLASRCGGCNLMHLSLDGQRQAKQEILNDALHRVGNNLALPDTIGFVRVGDGLAYRSRLRLHVDLSGRAGFLSARSKEIVPIQQCSVAEPLLNTALAQLAGLGDKDLRLLKLCDQLELRAAELEPRLIARLIPKPKLHLQAEHFESIFPPGTRVVIAGSVEDARVLQQYPLPSNVLLSAPASSFTQVNRAVNYSLVEDLVRAVTLRSLRNFVDAYAGAGNFTLPLLAAGLVGESIDCEPAGILAARSVARDRGLPFSGFQVGDAKAMLESFVRAGRQFDLVLLDPPRQGAKDVLPAAQRLRPQYIAIVACDPVSLARDLKTLAAVGGSIQQLTVYDMFPQTHHMEVLAIVEMPVASAP
jgi:23S rRNA (uracil1939-C5)-methyltransferase